MRTGNTFQVAVLGTFLSPEHLSSKIKFFVRFKAKLYELIYTT